MWTIAAAFTVGFIAGHVDEQISVVATCGVGAIYFSLRALGMVQFAVDHMTGDTFPPPAQELAETLDERKHRDQGAAK